MEDRNEQFKNEGNVSDALFGTSSDAIIEGLHQGVLTSQAINDGTEADTTDDKNQIVNEQDQNDITNALEEDEVINTSTDKPPLTAADYTPPMSKSEADTILSEDEHLDEAGDSEDGVSSQNLEKDKIN